MCVHVHVCKYLSDSMRDFWFTLFLTTGQIERCKVVNKGDFMAAYTLCGAMHEHEVAQN